jgi:rhamnogalacturonan endolyase
MPRTTTLALALVAAALLAACGGADTASGTDSGSRKLLATTSVASTFGVTAANGLLTVDSGAGLVFVVKQAGGDITSIRYNGGPELQLANDYSQLSSGLGATVSYAVSGGVAKITLSTPTATQYLLVRQGENNIYMGTYITAEPTVGELRWVTRFNPAYFNSFPVESNLGGAVSQVGEEDDVYVLADGTTRSKFYGNQRAMDLSIRGITGPGLGVFMAYGNRESSSGGPFYRDIQNQSNVPEHGYAAAVHVYNYLNSAHTQSEPFRTGFFGPYALLFNNGTATPAIPDMSWMESQNLSGLVPASQRGKVVGQGLYGFNLTNKFTVGFANATAQYWAAAKAPNGSFSIPAMKAGTYTMTVYKEELALYTETVTVQSGATTTLPLRTLGNDPQKDPAVWRIGTWDGTPLEFRNGDGIPTRHPSDVRNLPWSPTTYVVGDPARSFPALQWVRDINNPTTVRFTLTPEQVTSHTLRVGVTLSVKGARPQVKVNAWNSSNPSGPASIASRLTLGTYRGNNATYTFTVPASAFVAGTNTLTINAISGSTGNGFLSPALAYDAIDLL